MLTDATISPNSLKGLLVCFEYDTAVTKYGTLFFRVSLS
jgi:hypothetical protein